MAGTGSLPSRREAAMIWVMVRRSSRSMAATRGSLV